MASESPYRDREDGRAALGLVHHARNHAMFRTLKTEADFVADLIRDPRTRQSDTDTSPYPPPPDGAPLLWTQKGEALLQLRSYSNYSDPISPIVEVRVEDEGNWRCVYAEFCPAGHVWGEPTSLELPGFTTGGDDGFTAVLHMLLRGAERGARWVWRAAGLLFVRRHYRDAFIALIDRACVTAPRDSAP